MKEKRKVYIILNEAETSWFVMFLERRPKQRHSAAQFAFPDHGRAAVEDWVKSQKHLELVEDVEVTGRIKTMKERMRECNDPNHPSYEPYGTYPDETDPVELAKMQPVS